MMGSNQVSLTRRRALPPRAHCSVGRQLISVCSSVIAATPPKPTAQYTMAPPSVDNCQIDQPAAPFVRYHHVAPAPGSRLSTGDHQRSRTTAPAAAGAPASASRRKRSDGQAPSDRGAQPRPGPGAARAEEWWATFPPASSAHRRRSCPVVTYQATISDNWTKEINARFVRLQDRRVLDTISDAWLAHYVARGVTSSC